MSDPFGKLSADNPAKIFDKKRISGSDPAFVVVDPNISAENARGLSKREYFAIVALTGLANDNRFFNDGRTDQFAQQINQAVAIADLLIRRLNQEKDLIV